MDEAVIVAPTHVCERGDVEVAHEQMQAHIACRVERCVWKTAAYRTLVDAGRLTPPRWSPRERAAARGLAFLPLPSEPCGPSEVPIHTIRDVLSRLWELDSPAVSPSGVGGGDR